MRLFIAIALSDAMKDAFTAAQDEMYDILKFAFMKQMIQQKTNPKIFFNNIRPKSP